MSVPSNAMNTSSHRYCLRPAAAVVSVCASKLPDGFTCAHVAGELGNLNREYLNNSYSGVAMTLIDSLSTLAVIGNHTEFAKNVNWIAKHVSCCARFRSGVLSQSALKPSSAHDVLCSRDGGSSHTGGVVTQKRWWSITLHLCGFLTWLCQQGSKQSTASSGSGRGGDIPALQDTHPTEGWVVKGGQSIAVILSVSGVGGSEMAYPAIY